MMELRSHGFAAALLLVAGAYQFSPWKRTCLQCCRCPVNRTGGFRCGLRNGLSCLGCCWALMLLLFVGGVMNLWWLAALTVFVVLEKLTANWQQSTRFSGLLWVAAGLGVGLT